MTPKERLQMFLAHSDYIVHDFTLTDNDTKESIRIVATHVPFQRFTKLHPVGADRVPVLDNKLVLWVNKQNDKFEDTELSKWDSVGAEDYMGLEMEELLGIEKSTLEELETYRGEE